ncbi:MAG: hypothetical protein KC635_17120 [Myxococcales bacterium]|nr:hypothetical protein [Myxococcales bacterium]MCB9735041.1 hypothetical protein [Deltaproteobacteria bacterium]
MAGRSLLAVAASVIALAGCHAERGPGVIRLVSALADPHTVAVTVTPRHGDAARNLKVGPGGVAELGALAPGVYDIAVRVGERPILRDALGVGGGSRVTAVLYGRVPAAGVDATEPTTDAALIRALGGAEARPVNGDLPGLVVVSDDLRRAPDAAKVRVIALAPGVSPVTVAAARDGERVTLASGLAYPQATEASTELAPGEWTLTVTLGDAASAAAKRDLAVARRDLVTVLVLAGPSPEEPVHAYVIPSRRPPR